MKVLKRPDLIDRSSRQRRNYLESKFVSTNSIPLMILFVSASGFLLDLLQIKEVSAFPQF
jgi:hypothetical protein